MRELPTIEVVMNPIVHSYESSLTVRELLRELQSAGYRHAPIKEHSKLIGLVSERDLLAADDSITLKELCTSEVRIVEINTLLNEVLDFMWSESIGSVLIQDKNKLVGIFTTIDACRVFSEFLKYHFLEEPLPYVIS